MFVSLEISFKIRINFSLYSIKKKKKERSKIFNASTEWKESSPYVTNVKNIFLEKKKEVGEWNEIFKYSVRGVTDL